MYCKSTGELDANDMIGILGANGFIGRSVVRRLATNGHPIRAISRKFDTSFKERCPQNVEFIEADFTNSVRIINCVEGVSTLIILSVIFRKMSFRMSVALKLELNKEYKELCLHHLAEPFTARVLPSQRTRKPRLIPCAPME